MRRSDSNSGMTLLEVLIALLIFVGILLPLLRFVGPTANSSKVKDRKVAYAILKGESEVLYRNRMLPERQSQVCVDNTTYDVLFDSHTDSMMVDWTLSVNRQGKYLAGLHGLLYAPVKRNLR